MRLEIGRQRGEKVGGEVGGPHVVTRRTEMGVRGTLEIWGGREGEKEGGREGGRERRRGGGREGGGMEGGGSRGKGGGRGERQRR